MKRKGWMMAALLAVSPFAAVCARSGPQRQDARTELRADLCKAGGEYRMYDFSAVRLTPAPKGYKPVYISHFGRHGARYALGEQVYERLRGVLRKAGESGRLTPKGRDLLERYERFYPHVAHRGGELTFKGQGQLRELARRMYRDFPEVFKGSTVARAEATTSHRVILSMWAFTSELDRLDRDFDFTCDAGRVYLPSICPNSSDSPAYLPGKPLSAEAKASAEAFRRRKLDLEGFAARFFTEPAFLEAEYGIYRFMTDLRTVIVDIPNLDYEPTDRFEDIFTPEELIAFWQVWNYNGYLSMGRSPLTDRKKCLNMYSALRALIDTAERDLVDGRVRLRLRFTHDSALLPLFSFMKINSFGAEVEDPEEVARYWRCYDIPMACNLQLIFYRHPKKPDLLVKVLLNSREAALPFAPACPGFYSWEAFKSCYVPMIAAAEARLTAGGR